MLWFVNSAGVIVTDMDWTYSSSKPNPNRPDSLVIDLSVDSLETASSIRGRRLWRVGIFASKRPDGTGTRRNTKYQILNTFQAGKELIAGQTMRFDNLGTTFNLEDVSCDTGFKYLCLEFARSFRPLPGFEFTTITGGNTMIRCKQRPCDRG